MGWGDILHNALKDTEGLVNPKTYYRTAKFAVNNPVGFGKSVGMSYVDLVKHPERTLQNHPVDTLLQFAPVAGGIGKLADIGATAGAARLLEASVPTRSASMARLIGARTGAARLPGGAALKAGGVLVKDAKQRAASMVYDPGEAIPRDPYAGTVPGAVVDRGLLGKMNAELGHPNTTFGVRYPAKGDGIAGFYQHRTQNATAFLHPMHLLSGLDRSGASLETAAGADLTETILHEARHGYQKANWPLRKRLVDSYRKYDNRRVEQDANDWAQGKLEKYQGLVKVDPHNPDIPLNRLPHEEQMSHIARRNLDEMLDALKSGEAEHSGLTEGMFLNHLDNAVHDGNITPDEGIDYYNELYDAPRKSRYAPKKGAYSPPKSAQELFQRAADKAKLGRKDPTFAGNDAASIRAGLDRQFP